MHNHYRGILIFLLLVLIAFFTPTSKIHANLPGTYFDWRDQGYHFPVQDQLGCEAGYAFAGVGAIQAAIWKEEGVEVDLSENNAICCTWYALNNYRDHPHTCEGGDFKMIINLFTQKGLMLESCDPLNLQNPTCNQSCEPAYYVTEWQHINKYTTYISTNEIKDLVLKHGPLYAQMDANIPGFENFKGNGIIDDVDNDDTENIHAVLIVGWDDTLGESGVWIAKNSYGTDWGDDGYFYVAYKSAGVGKNVGFVTGWEKSSPTKKLYYYDHAGHTNQVDPDEDFDYKASVLGLFKIEEEEVIRSVEFWTTGASTVKAKMFTKFENGVLQNLVYESSFMVIPNAGYYHISLPSIEVIAVDDIVIELEIINNSNMAPIVTDYLGPDLSHNTWYKEKDGNWKSFTSRNIDAGIRLRTWVKTDGFTKIFLPIISR